MKFQLSSIAFCENYCLDRGMSSQQKLIHSETQKIFQFSSVGILRFSMEKISQNLVPNMKQSYINLLPDILIIVLIINISHEI